jgi:hypothetical protein
MAIQHVTLELASPNDLERFTLPTGVHHRLQELLERQDRGEALSMEERSEAEGLVNGPVVLSEAARHTN